MGKWIPRQLPNISFPSATTQQQPSYFPPTPFPEPGRKARRGGKRRGRERKHVHVCTYARTLSRIYVRTHARRSCVQMHASVCLCVRVCVYVQCVSMYSVPVLSLCTVECVRARAIVYLGSRRSSFDQCVCVCVRARLCLLGFIRSMYAHDARTHLHQHSVLKVGGSVFHITELHGVILHRHNTSSLIQLREGFG